MAEVRLPVRLPISWKLLKGLFYSAQVQVDTDVGGIRFGVIDDVGLVPAVDYLAAFGMAVTSYPTYALKKKSIRNLGGDKREHQIFLSDDVARRILSKKEGFNVLAYWTALRSALAKNVGCTD